MCNLLSHLFSFPLTILDAKELSITTIQVFLLLCAFSRRKNAVGFVFAVKLFFAQLSLGKSSTVQNKGFIFNGLVSFTLVTTTIKNICISR